MTFDPVNPLLIMQSKTYTKMLIATLCIKAKKKKEREKTNFPTTEEWL